MNTKPLCVLSSMNTPLSASFFFFYHFSFILLCLSSSQPSAHWGIYHPQFTVSKTWKWIRGHYCLNLQTRCFFLFVLQCSMWAATSVSVCVCIHIKVSVSIWLSVPVSVGLWVGNWARFNSRWSTGAEKVKFSQIFLSAFDVPLLLRETHSRKYNP